MTYGTEGYRFEPCGVYLPGGGPIREDGQAGFGWCSINTPLGSLLDTRHLNMYVRGMQDMNVDNVPLTRAQNFRANLRRIFAQSARGHQAEIARQAGLTPVHLSRIVGNGESNPTIETIEALSIALEISVETLLSAQPSEVDLKIFQKSA